MSKTLAILIGNDHPLFVANITQMEKASGHAGIDTALIAEVIEKAHVVMRRLGIDPADTSAKELYYALKGAVHSGRAHDLLVNTEYVLLAIDGQAVSFNFQDAIENYHHELHFESRTSAHGQRHLRAEIIKRYAAHERTDEAHVHNLAEAAGLKPPHDEGHPELQLSTENKPSLLAVGDIFTDAFIKLGDETARIFKDDDGVEWLGVPYGRKPPYERVDIVKSVGPSPNAAVSCKRLGLDVSLASWVGDDETGREMIDHLKHQGIATESMIIETGKKTSYWYVLSYKADRTMLIRSELYDYKFIAPNTAPDWMYLSYAGKDSWPLHEEVLKYLKANPSIKLAFQPGTFQFGWGAEKLAGMYQRSQIVIMNREEAMDVTGRGYDDVHALANGLHDLGPQIVVITDGPNGSYASYDYKFVTIPNYPDLGPPLDRTGAGDAFASTIVAALALGKPMDEALLWAPINSMSVVQKMGAQAGLLRQDEIEAFLASAPENYKIKQL